MGRSASIAMLLVVATAVAACNARGPGMSEREVEERVTEMVTQQFPSPQSVDCEGNLRAEVGATTRCVMVDENGGRSEFTVVASEVDGGDVKNLEFDLIRGG